MSKNVEKIYTLSPMQKGMVYHSLLNKNSTEYILQYSASFKGALNIENAKVAIELLSLKHEVLRTAFTGFENDSELFQVILKNRSPEIQFINYSDFQNNQSIEEIIKHDLIRGFDLKKNSLIRVTIINNEDNVYTLIWTAHHIIVDGWSLSILFEDFIYFYNMLETSNLNRQDLVKLIETENQNSPSYCEYIKWNKNHNWELDKKYWDNLLLDYDTVATILPTLKTDLLEKNDEEFVDFSISENLYKKLKKLGNDLHITINSIMESAWGLLLQYYSGNSDVVFGKVVSGRNIPINGIEKTVGLFINTIPVRVNSVNKTLKELLADINNQGIESSKYDNYSLLEIQKNRKMKQILFDTLLVFENYYVSDKSNENYQNMKNIIINQKGREKTNYSLTVLVQCGSTLNIRLLYDNRLYSTEDIKRVLNTMNTILNNITNSLDKKCVELNFLDDKEKEQVLCVFNSNKATYPIDKTINELFEKSVINYSKQIAVHYNDYSITYEQLNSYANQIAKELREQGVKPNEFVAIIADRSIEMIIGIYGILKSGGAFIPIDPKNPDERIEYILNDSNSKVVLTATTRVLEIKGKSTINLNNYNWSTDLCDNLDIVNTSNDIMYCIYTSGTTGKPKGVMCCHNGLVNRIMWMKQQYNITSKDIILQKTNYTFDPSIWEFILWALCGASVAILPPDEEKNPETLCQMISYYKISIIHFVPSMLDVLIEYLNTNKNAVKLMNSLKKVFCSGEILSINTVKNFYSLLHETKLMNLYGPTEASIDITAYECDKESNAVYIGKPIDNMNIYILQNNRLCGVGVPGELCVSGIGVAKGYLNNEQLTNEKFVNSQFSQGKMYHTGDIARWLSDGNIEYMGRIDDQVKIRGMRVELGEIEAVLKQESEIIDAIAVVKKDDKGDSNLYVYYTSHNKLDIDKVKNNISKKLPSHMIPKQFMRLDEIPHLSNGKVAKKALPDIQTNLSKDYVEPQNEVEQDIVNIISDVLGAERIGLSDQLYELGLDSIKAIRLSNALKEKGYSISIKELLTVDTVYDFINTINKKNDYILSPLQKRLMTYSDSFRNTCLILKCNERIVPLRLMNAINNIMSNHTMLNAMVINDKMVINDVNEYSLIEEISNPNTNTILNSKAINILKLEYSGDLNCIWEKCKEYISKYFAVRETSPFNVMVFRCKDFDYIVISVNPLFFDLTSEQILIDSLTNEYCLEKSRHFDENQVNSKLKDIFNQSISCEPYLKNNRSKNIIFNKNYCCVEFSMDVKSSENIRFKLGAKFGYDFTDAIVAAGFMSFNSKEISLPYKALIYKDLRNKDVQKDLDYYIGRIDSMSNICVETDVLHNKTDILELMQEVNNCNSTNIIADNENSFSIFVQENDYKLKELFESVSINEYIPLGASISDNPLIIICKVEHEKIKVSLYADKNLFEYEQLYNYSKKMKQVLENISAICNDNEEDYLELSEPNNSFISQMLNKYANNSLISNTKKIYCASKKQIEYYSVGEIMYGRLTINKKTSIKTMRASLMKTIQEQSVLRSVIHSKKNGKIQEIECDTNWFIPIIDISKNPSIEDSIFTNQEWLQKEKERFTKQDLLSSIICFRINSDTYHIWIIANHCIWDMKSFEVFERRLNVYLNDKVAETIVDYSEYISNLKKANLKELKSVFSDFFNNANLYLSLLNKKDKVCAVTKAIKTDYILKNYDSFNNLAFRLMQYNIKIWLPKNAYLTNIPVLMLYHNRNEENKNIAGLFVDQIPINIPIDEDSTFSVENQISNVINRWGKMPDIENVTLRKLLNKYRLIPIVNIAASYKYEDGGIENVMESWNNSLEKLNYVYSQSIYLHINSNDTIVTVITFERLKKQIEEFLDSL